MKSEDQSDISEITQPQDDSPNKSHRQQQRIPKLLQYSEESTAIDIENELEEMAVLNQFIELNIVCEREDEISIARSDNTRDQVKSLSLHVRRQGILLDTVVKERNKLEDKISQYRDAALQLCLEVRNLQADMREMERKIQRRDSQIHAMSENYFEAKHLLINDCAERILRAKMTRAMSKK